VSWGFGCAAAGAGRPSGFQFGEGRQAQLFRSPHRRIWPAELDLMAQPASTAQDVGHDGVMVRFS
jgi:hypothetical protein